MYKDMHYTCKYCGKQFNCNKGCITRHEKSCEYNPDAVLSKQNNYNLKDNITNNTI